MSGLLFILPHPDDETLAAGTIAKYAAEGVPIGLICATRGERGSTSDLCSIEELPRVREAEVRESARILGVREIDILPYEDQKLWTAPVDDIRRQIVATVRRQRPRIVVTFDPNGGNLHTDHIVISRFAIEAVSAAADPRWFPESGPPHAIERMLWLWHAPLLKPSRADNLAQQPGIDFLIDVSQFREQKKAALRAHGTQFAGLNRLFNSEPKMSLEAFRVGWGMRPNSLPADDLFAN
jgi:LmbE family N-acetylglucosaminyl deacetylase